MDEHRHVAPDALHVIRFSPPFSCFEHVEGKHPCEGLVGGQPAIHRILSVAGSQNAQTMLVAKTPANRTISGFTKKSEVSGFTLFRR